MPDYEPDRDASLEQTIGRMFLGFWPHTVVVAGQTKGNDLFSNYQSRFTVTTMLQNNLFTDQWQQLGQVQSFRNRDEAQRCADSRRDHLTSLWTEPSIIRLPILEHEDARTRSWGYRITVLFLSLFRYAVVVMEPRCSKFSQATLLGPEQQDVVSGVGDAAQQAVAELSGSQQQESVTEAVEADPEPAINQPSSKAAQQTVAELSSSEQQESVTKAVEADPDPTINQPLSEADQHRAGLSRLDIALAQCPNTVDGLKMSYAAVVSGHSAAASATAPPSGTVALPWMTSPASSNPGPGGHKIKPKAKASEQYQRCRHNNCGYWARVEGGKCEKCPDKLRFLLECPDCREVRLCSDCKRVAASHS